MLHDLVTTGEHLLTNVALDNLLLLNFILIAFSFFTFLLSFLFVWCFLSSSRGSRGSYGCRFYCFSLCSLFLVFLRLLLLWLAAPTTAFPFFLASLFVVIFIPVEVVLVEFKN